MADDADADPGMMFCGTKLTKMLDPASRENLILIPLHEIFGLLLQRLKFRFQSRYNVICDSGYIAEENSEEPFCESTINSFDFGPPRTANRWRTSHMVA